MERIGAGTTAIPHRDRARGARGRRAARRRGPWTRHNDTRDFVTVPPHRAIRGGSDRESTDHTTPPYDASMRTPARTRPRESEKPGVNCAFKILSLPYSGSPGVVFSDFTRSERNPGAPARRAPGLNSDPDRANTVTRTHACRCERRRNVAHHQNCTHFCTVKVLKRTPKANAERDSVRAPSRKPGLCGSGAPLGAALAACLTGGATTGTRTERWVRQSTGCCHTPRVEREFLKAQP